MSKKIRGKRSFNGQRRPLIDIEDPPEKIIDRHVGSSQRRSLTDMEDPVYGLFPKKINDRHGGSTLRRSLIDMDDPVYGLLYILLLTFSLVMYYTACNVDPGYINPKTYVNKKKVINNNTDEEDDNDTSENSSMINSTDRIHDNTYRYCDYCEIQQPMRSKHCEDCNKCVRKYDHHCPWLEACIGERNHKYFWLFLSSMGAFKYEQHWGAWFENNVFFLIDLLILICGGFTVLGLLGFHTYLLVKGLTTWEAVSRERITYLKYLDDDYNPFDEGLCVNIYYFLCLCKVRRWEVLYEKKAQ
ncbi:hypothetical protein KUTeg_022526, partial [Tegillarca granosa]